MKVQCRAVQSSIHIALWCNAAQYIAWDLGLPLHMKIKKTRWIKFYMTGKMLLLNIVQENAIVWSCPSIIMPVIEGSEVKA
jgi:hypothetical protein